MSIRKHRIEAAYDSHRIAEVAGGTARTRAPWLARRTARVKARAQAERGERGTADPATLADDWQSQPRQAALPASEGEGE